MQDIIQNRTAKNNAILHFLLAKQLTAAQKEKVEKRLRNSNIPAETVKKLLENLDSRNKQYHWAVAGFLRQNSGMLKDVLQGTASCQTLDELETVIKENVSTVFVGFGPSELEKITVYVCMAESEKYPEIEPLKQLCAYYWKEKVL